MPNAPAHKTALVAGLESHLALTYPRYGTRELQFDLHRPTTRGAVGPSWESFVIETLRVQAPRGTEAHFYRTSAGAEIGLVLTLPGGRWWSVEIKRSSAPKLERGFHFTSADLEPANCFVVYPGIERFPLDAKTEMLGLAELGKLLQASSA